MQPFRWIIIKKLQKLQTVNILYLYFNFILNSLIFYTSGRHLTVFNSQYLVQIGGRFLEAKQIVEHPFQVELELEPDTTGSTTLIWWFSKTDCGTAFPGRIRIRTRYHWFNYFNMVV